MPLPYNLKVTLDKAWKNLSCKNPKELVVNKGAAWDEETHILTLPVLNDGFKINCRQQTINAISGEPIEPCMEVLSLHYLTSSAVNLKGEWISFKELPGGIIYQQPFYGRAVMPLIRTFGRKPADLIRTGQILAGKPVNHGDASIELYPFPFIAVRLVIWAGDAELAPGGTILFDASAPTMLATEDFAVLAEYLVRSLNILFMSSDSL